MKELIRIEQPLCSFAIEINKHESFNSILDLGFGDFVWSYPSGCSMDQIKQLSIIDLKKIVKHKSNLMNVVRSQFELIISELEKTNQLELFN